MTTQPVEYYLTRKGEKFRQLDPKYNETERAIIDVLKDGKKSITSIMNIVNKENNLNRSWYYIKLKLELLERESLLKKYTSRGISDAR